MRDKQRNDSQNCLTDNKNKRLTQSILSFQYITPAQHAPFNPRALTFIDFHFQPFLVAMREKFVQKTRKQIFVSLRSLALSLTSGKTAWACMDC